MIWDGAQACTGDPTAVNVSPAVKEMQTCTPGSWTKLALVVTRKTNEQKNNRIALKK